MCSRLGREVSANRRQSNRVRNRKTRPLQSGERRFITSGGGDCDFVSDSIADFDEGIVGVTIVLLSNSTQSVRFVNQSSQHNQLLSIVEILF